MEMFSQQAGDVLARVALDASSVTPQELYDAVSFSWLARARSADELLNPLNHRVVELYCTP